MCSSTPYRWLIYSNDSIMEFSNREFSFMETSFPEIFCQGFFFHGKFFSWNFPFHEIKIFPGIFLIMENSFHGICFHSIFFLKFSFMEKKFMENSCSPKPSYSNQCCDLITWENQRLYHLFQMLKPSIIRVITCQNAEVYCGIWRQCLLVGKAIALILIIETFYYCCQYQPK